MEEKSVGRRVDVFTLHCNTTSGPVSYKDLFENLSSIQPRERMIEYSNSLIAAPTFEIKGDVAFLTVYKGEKDAVLLVFDPESGRERTEHLEGNEVLAEKSHLAINLASRISISEYNRRGPKIHDTALLIMSLGREFSGYGTLDVGFSPIIGERFTDEVDRFERIRQTSIRVKRPNQDWDQHEEGLLDFVGESRGSSFEFIVNAARGLSLNRAKGIIPTLKKLVNEEHPSLENAKVTGTREGEERETTVNSKKFNVHLRRTFRKNEAGAVDEGDAKEKLMREAEVRRR